MMRGGGTDRGKGEGWHLVGATLEMQDAELDAKQQHLGVVVALQPSGRDVSG